MLGGANSVGDYPVGANFLASFGYRIVRVFLLSFGSTYFLFLNFCGKCVQILQKNSALKVQPSHHTFKSRTHFFNIQLIKLYAKI